MASEQPATELTPLVCPPSSSRDFKASLGELLAMPWHLFVLYLVNFLVSVQFYTLVTLIPLYFSNELGASDLVSGSVFGGLGVLIGLLSISFGNFTAQLGVKHSLYLTCLASAAGFTIMAMSRHLYTNLLAILVFHSVAGATAWPVVELGAKQLTNERVRSLSNSIIMMSNYLGGVSTGIIIDCLYESHQNCQIFFVIGAALGLLAFALSVCIKTEPLVEEEPPSLTKRAVDSTFLRFAALIAIVTLIRACSFEQLDAALGKYMQRTIGPGAHFGLMLAVHSVTMLLGVLSLTVLVYYFDSYTLMLAGASLAAVSALWMAAGAAYWNTILFVVLLSVGESILVPRLLDYTLLVAPLHAEGVYLALNNCQFYFGMILAGGLSGVLLETFCSEEGDPQCWLLWLVASSATSTLFFVLLVCRRWLEEVPQKQE